MPKISLKSIHNLAEVSALQSRLNWPIIFCGGFGKLEGKPLSEFDMLSIELAHKAYPNKSILCFTVGKSWANLPNYAYRIEVPKADLHWKAYKNKEGAHTSDRIRLLALLQLGGLYMDTDVYVRMPYKGWDAVNSEELWVARQGAILVNNGIMFTPCPGNQLLREWVRQYELRKTPGSWAEASVNMLTRLAAQSPRSVVIEPDVNKFQGAGGSSTALAKINGESKELPGWLDSAYTVHLMGATLDEGTLGKLIFDELGTINE